MTDFGKVDARVEEVVEDDGTVRRRQLSTRRPRLAVGRVLSLNPARVRLRGGETVDVDAYLRTGHAPAVGDDVAIVQVGGFRMVLGEVVDL